MNVVKGWMDRVGSAMVAITMKPMLHKVLAPILLLAVCNAPTSVRAQAGESDLRVYGYLQASFYQQMVADGPKSNTFTAQQLDIMLHKDLRRRWSAFVDLLFTNNYSSFRGEGTFDLEQAWVRYRRSHYLNVKLGLLIPQFNYLNEIRNKMPVLPYIIRPIVYETSFQEDVNIQEYIPQKAYAQVYGYAPVKQYKIEYAGYVGNSPNINRDPSLGNTGVDTTDTFLVGGRVGVRHSAFQIGFSATHDKVDFLNGVIDTFTPPLEFRGVPRVRLGGDLLFEYKNLSGQAEFITVNYDDDDPVIDVDKQFYYATVGYRFTEPLFVYAGYWLLKSNYVERTTSGLLTAKAHIKIPNGGVAYQMSDRIVFKGAVARVIQKFDIVGLPQRTFSFYAVAVSVTF